MPELKPTKTIPIGECRAILGEAMETDYREANRKAEMAKLLENGTTSLRGEARKLQDEAVKCEERANATFHVLRELASLGRRRIDIELAAKYLKPRQSDRDDFWLLAALEARREGDEAQATVRELAATLKTSEFKIKSGLLRLHRDGLIETGWPRDGEVVPRFRLKTKIEIGATA